MIETAYPEIFTIEILRNSIGLALIFIELRTLKSTLGQKSTLALIGILMFHNIMYLTRLLGIIQENSILRQFGPALSAFISSVFVIIWGSQIMQFSRNKERLFLGGIFIGVGGFIFGRIFSLMIFELFGIILFATILIIVISKMFLYVFNKSPYIRARQRVFLMGLAFVVMILFEGSGVMTMRNERYLLASLFFALELIARILMTISILMPKKVQEVLSLIIY